MKNFIILKKRSLGIGMAIGMAWQRALVVPLAKSFGAKPATCRALGSAPHAVAFRALAMAWVGFGMAGMAWHGWFGTAWHRRHSMAGSAWLGMAWQPVGRFASPRHGIGLALAWDGTRQAMIWYR